MTLRIFLDPGPSKSGRKRSVPVDAFTRASEKRKLASRLAHFGGPESLHRLKKIKIRHQSPKPSKVSSPAVEKPQTKEHNIVLETPWFERHNVRAEFPKTVHEDFEVQSLCTRVLRPTFGFGTPARASKHMATTRKRCLALFKEKKPPGRGLPLRSVLGLGLDNRHLSALSSGIMHLLWSSWSVVVSQSQRDSILWTRQA